MKKQIRRYEEGQEWKKGSIQTVTQPKQQQSPPLSFVRRIGIASVDTVIESPSQPKTDAQFPCREARIEECL